MKIKPIIALLIIVSASIWLLSSCGNNKQMKDLQAYISKLKQATPVSQTVSASRMPSMPVAIKYSGNSWRAPFSGTGAVPSQAKSISNPLQGFPLTMLRFIGTLSQDKGIFAYVLAPDNRIYQVQMGDFIGDHHERVAHIYPDRLEVKEQGSESIKVLRIK